MNFNNNARLRPAFSVSINQQSNKNVDTTVSELRRQIRSIESYCGPCKRTQNLREEIIALQRNV